MNFYYQKFKYQAATNKVIWSYYSFQVFFSLLVWIPVFFEIQKKSGLSIAEIFKIQGFYYLAFCIFELPTGLLADKIGHKKVLKLGALVLIIANLAPVIFSNYNGFFYHFMLIALSRSLVSGSASAFLYDYLKEKQMVDIFKKVEGRARSFSLVARIMVWPLAGIFMQYSLNLPYLITAIFSILAYMSTIYIPVGSECLQENDSKLLQNLDYNKTYNNFSNKIKSLLDEFRQSRLLPFFILQGAGIFVLQRICFVQLFGPLLKIRDFPIESFGIVMAVLTFFESFGAFKAHSFFKKFKDYNLVFVATLILVAMFFLMGHQSKIIVFIALAIFSLTIGISHPSQKQLLNDNIVDSSNRATILSLESLIDRLLCSFFSFTIASKLEHNLINDVLFNTGTVTLLFVVFVWILIRNHLKKAGHSYQLVETKI